MNPPSLLNTLIFVTLIGCSQNSELSQFAFSQIPESKVGKIVFLVETDPWGGTVGLDVVASPVTSPVEIYRFLDLMKKDSGREPAKESLAGVVVYIVVCGTKGEVLESAALLVGDAVLSPRVINYKPDQKSFAFAESNKSGPPAKLPRRALTFGSSVLAYLKKNDPTRFAGVEFVNSGIAGRGSESDKVAGEAKR